MSRAGGFGRDAASPSFFKSGRSWGVCDRCGIKLDLSMMKVEWTGLRVGPECFDPRPAELTPPYIDPREGTPTDNPRPRAPDQFISDADPVDPADL